MNYKRFFSVLSLCFAWLLATADGINLDNLHFEINKGGNAVSVKAAKGNELVNVEIPARVQIKGRYYPVSAIEAGGFKKCRNLKSIVVPNTVENIGAEAFLDCKELESVVMPDKCTVEITDGSYGFGRYGIFKGCKSLKRLRGTTVMYPQYVVLDALFDCKDVPAYELMTNIDPSEIDRPGSVNSKFTSFMKENYLDAVDKWQRRKSYETVAQWESRVNDNNRRKMVEEAMVEGRKEFLKNFSPVSVKGTLEDYDMENQIFPISLGELGTVYASVPQSEAESFAKNWDNVKINADYGIIDDAVGITHCSFTSGDKTYTSPRDYIEDGSDELLLMITPLAALREYEAQLLSKEKRAEETETFAPDEIDIDIPDTNAKRERTFAVIIGNENYQRVAKVDFAHNDARVLAKYFTRTLGIPESNVRTYYDATYGDIVAAMEDIKSVSDAFKGDIDVIFYYAGHGLPDESSRGAFLLPIDANGTSTEVCYPVSKLYAQLGELKSHHTVAILDACFSGSLRGDGMLASARGVKLRPKEISATGNLVVFSAASGDQTAYPYKEKNHGLFSYYLIKKLNENKGNVSLGELAEYLRDNVSQQAITVNKKPQAPTVKWSDGLNDTWRDITF